MAQSQPEARSRMSVLGSKLLAGLVLAVAAYVLFKVVVGAITAVAWLVAIVIGVVAIFWAPSVLRR